MQNAEISAMENEGIPIEQSDLTVVYGNLTTIDWMRDILRDHRRRYRFFLKKHSLVDLVTENAQSWIIVLVSGVFIGLIAGWIDVAAAFLTDKRIGHCKTEWYASQKVCCKNSINTGWVLFHFISKLDCALISQVRWVL